MQAEKASILLSSVGPSVQGGRPGRFFASPGGCPPADGPEGEPRPRKQEEKSGTGEPTGKKSNTHRTERPPGVARGIRPTGGGNGGRSPPRSNSGGTRTNASLQFQSETDDSPFVGEISRDSANEKRGRASMRTGALEWANAASAGCQPVRADRLLASPAGAEARGVNN